MIKKLVISAVILTALIHGKEMRAAAGETRGSAVSGPAQAATAEIVAGR